MSFQIHGLPGTDFAHLFAKTDAELKAMGAVRVIADQHPGMPCRVSLAEAEIGDEMILTNHVYLPETSPYRASHAIYVRKNVAEADLGPNVVPSVMTDRLLSVRGFTADHMMEAGEIVEGADLPGALEQIFTDPAIDYIHIHYAKRGCFAGKATR